MKYTVGLLYDFLLNRVTKQYLEGAILEQDIDVICEIKKNDEFNKELELYEYLKNVHVTNDLEFHIIVNEVKNKLKDIDYQFYLDSKEKVLQKIEIKDVSDYLQKQKKNQVVNDSIINWLDIKNNKIDDIVKLEKKLNDVLKSLESDKDKKSIQEHDENFGKYIVSLMKKKYDEKYSSVLNEQQKELIQLYVDNKQELLCSKLNAIRNNLKETIKERRKDMTLLVNSKLDEISQFLSEDVVYVNDDLIKQYMLYIKLNNNLCED